MAENRQQEEHWDFQLSDGTRGRVDRSSVTLREWRAFWNYQTPDEQNDQLLARVTGLSLEYIQTLLLTDYRRLADAFRAACMSPLDDPKGLASAPTLRSQ